MAWNSEMIDMDAALSRVLGHKELYKGWLDAFFKDENFICVTEAFEKKDSEGLQQALHRIKGTAGNLSVLTVFNQALLFNTKVKDGYDICELTEDYNKLRDDFYTAKKMYEENIKDLIN